MFRIKRDNESRKFGHEEHELPWTLWEGAFTNSFHATREEAEEEFEELKQDAREEVSRVERLLQEAEDWLDDLEATKEL